MEWVPRVLEVPLVLSRCMEAGGTFRSSGNIAGKALHGT